MDLLDSFTEASETMFRLVKGRKQQVASTCWAADATRSRRRRGRSESILAYKSPREHIFLSCPPGDEKSSRTFQSLKEQFQDSMMVRVSDSPRTLLLNTCGQWMSKK